MFDIDGDEILALNDEDLRSLVARLCEAELIRLRLSPAAVTWGGNHTAADGGLDVRVTLPDDTHIDGFLPRRSTGFQVKKPDMPKKKIFLEMRPKGSIRPVIQDLANESGSYIIVSSTGSTSDSALIARKNAMHAALTDVSNGERLHVDFYDRSRIATWVRLFPGLALWVKSKIGKSISGWHPYGAWCGGTEEVNGEYLFDEHIRIHIGKQNKHSKYKATDAIDYIRGELIAPRRALRLVGLSGVGKTRFAQALFDSRIGSSALPDSLAIYTDLSDNPNPQPIGLASSLIANQSKAILIIDNCPPDLHSRLFEICSATNSTISVMTIEYDVRDDQPEGTQVIALEASSTLLIESLIRRRYPHISRVDASTIAGSSGGNYRIAIALAETIEQSESISGISNENLFQRLFRQRHDFSEPLYISAQACSLVYSFEGESTNLTDSELSKLASLADQPANLVYRHVEELRRRNLVQSRSKWRAVLPHAIANRLAATALENTPLETINTLFLREGSERLLLSFSRRLSYMHNNMKAKELSEIWLNEDGLLGDPTNFNDLKKKIFENIAPVNPELTISTLERVKKSAPSRAVTVWSNHRNLIRSIAYEPALFQRCLNLITEIALHKEAPPYSPDATSVFKSFFPLYFSGTRASLEQRLQEIDNLFKSPDPERHNLGLLALKSMLQTSHFSSTSNFSFGARSRDFGYQPESRESIIEWYTKTLSLISQLAYSDKLLTNKLRTVIAERLVSLWRIPDLTEQLFNLCKQLSSDGFWSGAWTAYKALLRRNKDKATTDRQDKLKELESILKPSNLTEQIEVIVFSSFYEDIEPDDFYQEASTTESTSKYQTLENLAYQMGETAAANSTELLKLLPRLIRGGPRVGSFAAGLARHSDPDGIWTQIARELRVTPTNEINDQIVCGFVAELNRSNHLLKETILDQLAETLELRKLFPAVQAAAGLNGAGFKRLEQLIDKQEVSAHELHALAHHRSSDTISASLLRDFLIRIANSAEGVDVALEILFSQIFSDQIAKREPRSELIAAGLELFEKIKFSHTDKDSYQIVELAKICLSTKNSGSTATKIAANLKEAIRNYEASPMENARLLETLLSTHPRTTLTTLFDDEADEDRQHDLFDVPHELYPNPADSIPLTTLLSWCEEDPIKRFPIAARICTIHKADNSKHSEVWTIQALEILNKSPDPEKVIRVFSARLYPMSWSGSRAAVMEKNATLLEDLEAQSPQSTHHWIQEEIQALAKAIEYEKTMEFNRDRARDERFE